MSENVSTEEADISAQRPPRERIDTLDRLKQIPATSGLIGFTALVYISQILIIELTGRDHVGFYGAKINEYISAGEIWRLITPVFVHANPWHILVNMYSLYALGPAVERLFSSQRMLVLYLLSGISGVIFSLGFSPYDSVGASGAIFGLLGALGTFIYKHRNSLGQAGRLQLRQIVLVTLLNLGLGLMPMIDNWGHLGGLLAGITLTWTLGPQMELSLTAEDRPRFVDRRPWQEVRMWSLLAILILGLLAFAASLSPFVR